MFKLVVLSAIFAVAAARPGLLGSPVVYSTPIVQEHSLAKVGAVVKSIPTAVSHQSSTVVHNSAQIVEPIVAPVVKTYAAAPVIKTIQAPLVQTYASAPVLKTYAAAAAPLAVAAPAHISYAAPAHLGYAAPAHLGYAAPAHLNYAAPAHLNYAAAPVAYASGW